MTMIKVKQICKNCRVSDVYKYNQQFFIGGPKEVVIEYDSCLICCDPVEPKFDSIEEALAYMIRGGRGLPPLERKWFAYNTPLPFIDSDEEAMEVADELKWVSWQQREKK